MVAGLIDLALFAAILAATVLRERRDRLADRRGETTMAIPADQPAPPLVLASCLLCQGPVWVSQGSMTETGMPLCFDLLPPKGPGDVKLLMVLGCCYEDGDDGFDSLDDLDDWELFPG